MVLNEDKPRLRLSTWKSLLVCVKGQMESTSDSREGTEGIPKMRRHEIKLQLGGMVKCSGYECYLHLHVVTDAVYLL